MTQLPMPSDVSKRELAAGAAPGAAAPGAGGSGTSPGPQNLTGGAATELGEPPSAKLLVRLFLIPLLVVAAAVGVMVLISMMAGGTPTLEEALTRLKNPGGQRTAEMLVGPGSKQRYMDAKTIVDKMKAGMSEPERVKLADDLADVLNNHTKPGEGEIRHFLLLALGRAWQVDPAQPPMDSSAAVESRQRTMGLLTRYANDEEIATRKAALLAMVYFAGRSEVSGALPTLVQKLLDANEDVDVRIAAATSLGPLATPRDQGVIDALHVTSRDDDPHRAELSWSSALSLAQLNQKDSADMILKLLSRQELAQMQYYDRETDPKNPTFRTLGEQEQQRILINTMIGARHLDVPEVQKRLKELAEHDPSPRVRAAGRDLLQSR